MNLTKKQMTILGSAMVAVVIIIGGIFFYRNAQPSADSAWKKYQEAWIKKDYESMYAMLSTQAKETHNHDTFIKKYQNIYDGIEASNIKIETKDILDNDQGKTAAYHLSMDSIAGPIAFDQTVEIVKEDGEYKLNWSYAQIFPQMQDGDGITISTEDAKRGDILDRNNELLATDGEVLEVGVVPGKLSSKDEIKTLAKRLDISEDAIEQAMSASWVKDDLFVPVKTISKDTDFKYDDLPGVSVHSTTARIYPYKELCAHFTGYVQTINAEELEAHQGQGYTATSIIGKSGLESIYESKLHGESGVAIQVVRNGSVVDTIQKSEVKNGANIKTTIDVNVQKKVYEQLKKDQGAGVVMKPDTGEVLALVSTPAYDPNDFSLGMSNEKWNELTKDSDNPLENRFTGLYAPGSTFKAITGVAGLDTKAMSAEDDLGQATNKKWQKDSSWGDYYVTTTTAYDGAANLENAMIYSDNTYFAKVALKMGASSYAKQLDAYGFNEKMDFPFAVKASSYGEASDLEKDITLADTGYGQGKLQVSPIHLTAMYAMIQNKGTLPMPYLLYQDGKAKVWKEQAVSETSAAIMQKDLIASYAQFGENPANAGGKTGTAEVGDKEIGWLCSINQDYAITLMVDHTEDVGGSKYVVPLMQSLWRSLLE